MRITGGQWCGRTLLMPKSDLVRPTQDRVREALFNLLNPVLLNARVLDLFAGSGAVGLDALSRGATEVTFFERDKTVFATLKKNLEAFGVAPHCAQNRDSLTALGLTQEASASGKMRNGSTFASSLLGAPYDIVFADPPYLWAKENGFALLSEALIRHDLLKPGALFVTETDYRTDATELPHFTLLRDRLYGKTRLAIYRYTPDTTP